MISASYADLEETAQLFPEVLLLTRSVVVEQTKYYRQRLDNIRTMKAEARYRTLLEKHPRIVQNFPVYILASFLGIAPTSLSRLRRR